MINLIYANLRRSAAAQQAVAEPGIAAARSVHDEPKCRAAAKSGGGEAQRPAPLGRRQGGAEHFALQLGPRILELVARRP